ncbi:MAG: fused MFS/spermidine synthase [Acidobacteria bacterium]|nr:fused MFS/spermidine synthase [Acidobacteriota bacterium]
MELAKTGSYSNRRNAARVILLCFFASGFSGLVYQVIWVRELVLVFGATTFAVSTVLTAFMGGLALGSFYFGRRTETIKQPLKLYAWLEIGIGIYGLAVPFIFALLPKMYQPFWRWLHLSFLALSLVRFLFAALVLIVPTALMGATLPVLSSYYARELNRIGLRVGSLYALNTFGAVLGAAATGFLLIPAIGMSATTATAAAINLALGFAALHLSRRYESHFTELELPEAFADAEPQIGLGQSAISKSKHRRNVKPATVANPVPSLSKLSRLVVLTSFALSGFIALSYEVIWSRVLALIIGSSVYAFSIMLATFLVGLALGAAMISRFVDRIKNHIFMFAVIEVGVGLTSFGGAFLFNELPFAFVQLHRYFETSTIGVLLLARFLIAAAVIIAPTLLLGALFPLVVKIISGKEQTSGRAVGDAYSANTLGAILGSFASGFILIPTLGLLGSLKLCVALNFVVAAALFIIAKSKREAKQGSAAKPANKTNQPASFQIAQLAAAALAILLVVTVAVAHIPWNSDLMSSAVYRYAPSMSQFTRQDFLHYVHNGQGETVFYKEGLTATVAVQKLGNDRVLKVNGKPEASTSGDMPTQVLIGALPLLVRQHTDNVLLIGLGSGVTLGSIEQFPIKRVTCVELEPAVVEASKQFNEVNNRPLEDERLQLISNDGRNFIYTTNEKFDVIVSEPSNPWVTGVANLFTLEYFQRGAAALSADGIFSQWLQLYEMSPDDMKTLIATFKAAFPYVNIFRGAAGDLMLLGSKREPKLDFSIIKGHLTNNKIAGDLQRVQTYNVTDLLSRFYLGTDEVTAISAVAKINTDDNALIEFNAPRRVGAAEETVATNLKELLARTASPLKYISGNDSPSDNDVLIEAAIGAVKRDDKERAEQFVRYALEMKETAQAHGILGELRAAQNDEAGALEEWQAALVLDPYHFHSLINLGKLYLTRQEAATAVPYLERALKIDATSARAHHLRGLAYQAMNNNEGAVVEYRKALPDAKYTRSVQSFYLNFGMALMSLGYYEEAAQMLEEYTRLAPNDVEGHAQLGASYEIQAERSLDDALSRRAVEALKRALTINPKHPMSHYYLSKAYRRLEMYDEADIEFELYERLMP